MVNNIVAVDYAILESNQQPATFAEKDRQLKHLVALAFSAKHIVLSMLPKKAELRKFEKTVLKIVEEAEREVERLPCLLIDESIKEPLLRVYRAILVPARLLVRTVATVRNGQEVFEAAACVAQVKAVAKRFQTSLQQRAAVMAPYRDEVERLTAALKAKETRLKEIQRAVASYSSEIHTAAPGDLFHQRLLDVLEHLYRAIRNYPLPVTTRYIPPKWCWGTGQTVQEPPLSDAAFILQIVLKERLQYVSDRALLQGQVPVIPACFPDPSHIQMAQVQVEKALERASVAAPGSLVQRLWKNPNKDNGIVLSFGWCHKADPKKMYYHHFLIDISLEKYERSRVPSWAEDLSVYSQSLLKEERSLPKEIKELEKAIVNARAERRGIYTHHALCHLSEGNNLNQVFIATHEQAVFKLQTANYEMRAFQVAQLLGAARTLVPSIKIVARGVLKSKGGDWIYKKEGVLQPFVERGIKLRCLLENNPARAAFLEHLDVADTQKKGALQAFIGAFDLHVYNGFLTPQVNQAYLHLEKGNWKYQVQDGHFQVVEGFQALVHMYHSGKILSNTGLRADNEPPTSIETSATMREACNVRWQFAFIDNEFSFNMRQEVHKEALNGIVKFQGRFTLPVRSFLLGLPVSHKPLDEEVSDWILRLEQKKAFVQKETEKSVVKWEPLNERRKERVQKWIAHFTHIANQIQQQAVANEIKNLIAKLTRKIEAPQAVEGSFSGHVKQIWDKFLGVGCHYPQQNDYKARSLAAMTEADELVSDKNKEKCFGATKVPTWEPEVRDGFIERIDKATQYVKQATAARPATLYGLYATLFPLLDPMVDLMSRVHFIYSCDNYDLLDTKEGVRTLHAELLARRNPNDAVDELGDALLDMQFDVTQWKDKPQEERVAKRRAFHAVDVLVKLYERLDIIDSFDDFTYAKWGSVQAGILIAFIEGISALEISLLSKLGPAREKRLRDLAASIKQAMNGPISRELHAAFLDKIKREIPNEFATAVRNAYKPLFSACFGGRFTVPIMSRFMRQEEAITKRRLTEIKSDILLDKITFEDADKEKRTYSYVGCDHILKMALELDLLPGGRENELYKSVMRNIEAFK